MGWLVEPGRGLIELFHSADEANRSIEGMEAIRVDAGAWTTETALAALGDALGFPGYFGKSLDAFADCMFDVVCGEYGFESTEGPRALVIFQFDSFVATDAARAHVIVEILYESAVTALKRGTPLLVILQSDDPALRLPEVGATAVGWSRLERPNPA